MDKCNKMNTSRNNITDSCLYFPSGYIKKTTFTLCWLKLFELNISSLQVYLFKIVKHNTIPLIIE